jgi:hypothetical protein
MPCRSISHEQKIKPVATGPELPLVQNTSNDGSQRFADLHFEAGVQAPENCQSGQTKIL